MKASCSVSAKMSDTEENLPSDIRGDQIGLFKLVTLNCILNCITGVTFGC
jgi:hypothetical protein